MKILFLSDMTVSSVIRQELIGKRLFEKGYQVSMLSVQNLTPESLLGYNIIGFIRPTGGIPEVMNVIRKNSPRTFIICDQDDCFDAVPVHHVAYKYLGKGNPKQEQVTKDAMALSNYVTVSTTQLQDYYSAYNPHVIPNGWDANNKAWDKHNSHQSVVIGWAGTITHREDFKLVVEPIRKIMRKYPHVNLLIGADETIYRQFLDIDVNRRLFIPMVPYDDYPLTVKWMDILLAPLQNDKFNTYKSDIKLVEAGAARIPFIASPLPNYTQWKLGGIYAGSSNEFFDALENLVNNPVLRTNLSEGGRYCADLRESKIIADTYWEPIMEEARKWVSS